ncbi:transcriptional regulator [Roseobacteraceae bacterium NS-SX3]
MSFLLKVRHFGAFGVSLASGHTVTLGAKHQALMALLSTAEGGIRTRAFLERTLWSLAQPEQAKASLRTALSTLRRHLGPEAAQVLSANRERVILDLGRVEVDGDCSAGEFMEGFELPYERVFGDWLSQTRRSLADAPRQSRACAAPRPDHSRLIVNEMLPPLAVLPFLHRPQQDGSSPLGGILGEELCRALSRSQAFTVTSYLASRQFDPHLARPCEVASRAGVSFLVSGSVSVSGQSFLAEVDLHDAVRERVIWSRQFEGSLASLTRGRSRMLLQAVQQIGQTVVGEAVRMTAFKPLAKLESHTLLMAAIAMMQEMKPERFGQAQEILAVLLEREPQHPLVLTWMGFWHVLRVQKGFAKDRQLEAHLASQLAAAALAADPAFSLAHTLKGAISSHLMFRFDLAQDSYDLALKDNPNEALALLLKGATRAYQDMPDEAVRLTDAARRLTPLGPQRYYFDALSATANLSARNYDRAIQLADRSLEANAAYPASLRTKAIALQMSGRSAEARGVVQSLLRVAPGFSLVRYRRDFPAAAAPAGAEWAHALARAGVPE